MLSMSMVTHQFCRKVLAHFRGEAHSWHDSDGIERGPLHQAAEHAHAHQSALARMSSSHLLNACPISISNTAHPLEGRPAIWHNRPGDTFGADSEHRSQEFSATASGLSAARRTTFMPHKRHAKTVAALRISRDLF